MPAAVCVLRLGPDAPASQRWLWRNWGTTWPLRRVERLGSAADAATPAETSVSDDTRGSINRCLGCPDCASCGGFNHFLRLAERL